jgi:hypothetical protein
MPVVLVHTPTIDELHIDDIAEVLEQRYEAYCEDFLDDHPFREDVAQWCPLVRKYFGPEWTHWALHIIECESGGSNIRNRGGGSASGLFQHLPRYWDRRAERAGWPGASIWDEEANIAVSAWLLNDGKGRSHWSCKARK